MRGRAPGCRVVSGRLRIWTQVGFQDGGPEATFPSITGQTLHAPLWSWPLSCAPFHPFPPMRTSSAISSLSLKQSSMDYSHPHMHMLYFLPLGALHVLFPLPAMLFQEIFAKLVSSFPLDLCTSIIWPYYAKGQKLQSYALLSFWKQKEGKMWKQRFKFFLKVQKFHPPYPIFILLHSIYHHLIMYRLFICSSRAGIFLFLSFHFYISAPRIVSSTQQALMNICRKTDSMTSLLWHPCWFVAMLWFFLTKRDSYSEGYYHPPISLRSS